MTLWGPSIWICGRPDVESRVLDGLSLGGRRARAVDSEALERLAPGRCRTLILADPPDIDALVRRIGERLSARPQAWRGRPLRLILMHRGDTPPGIPRTLEDLDAADRLRLETFVIESRAARAILARWPLHFGMDPGFGQRPHLLLVGVAPPAFPLLVQALRLAHYDEERPRATLACEDPVAAAAAFVAAYPQAGEIAELHWTPMDAIDPALWPPVTQVLVCLDPPKRGLDLAGAVARRLAEGQGLVPPILLEVGDARPAGVVDDWDGQTFPFSYLAQACDPKVLLDGEGDELARTIHEHYVDSIAAQGRDLSQEPAGRTWGRLAESYRQANRHQADHLGAKLAAIDCRAVPEERVESFAFAPLEAERLAVVEHLRWAADRWLDGWSYAPRRDNALKHHPQLVSYPQLSEPMKDLDRYAVRGVPALLARSGLGVVRTLIVGLPDPDSDLDAGSGATGSRALARSLDRALERLLLRYPDRSLVVASTLAHPWVRLAVRRALDLGGAALYLLCPQPVGELLKRQSGAEFRRDLLGLVARAERRICLAGAGELDRWLAERAEIQLVLGPETQTPTDGKRVSIDPASGRTRWGFEY